MVLFAKFRRLIRVLKKYTLKFIFRPWKGIGAGFGCRILFGFAAFNDKFHGALLSDRLLLVFSSPKNPPVFWREGWESAELSSNCAASPKNPLVFGRRCPK
jgi:hypothetical protein